MTNTQVHAKRELEILEKTISKPIIAPFKKEILALCEAFGNSGQSGGSAPFTARAISDAINKLLLFETIAPLTGEDDEWVDVSDIQSGETDIMKYQNKRDSRVFKQENGRAYFIDAIVFDGDIGGRFTGGGSVEYKGKKIGSSQYIKKFPFTPKTFYVDVIDHRFKDKNENEPDENGDWWTHEIKDETQLKEVFEYYNLNYIK